ncbi:hypothetical protein, partial [Flavobacterium sp. 3-210]
NGTLVISFVGFETVNEVIGGRTKLTIALKAVSQSLNEVVVIGYGTQKKALITGASTNLKGETLQELNTGSAMEALQGIAPG